MTPEEIRNASNLPSKYTTLEILCEIAAQLAEQNEQIRDDRKFREAVREEQRAEVKKQQEFIALSAGGLEAFRKTVEQGPQAPPRVVYPDEVLHLGCLIREPDGTHAIAAHEGQLVRLDEAQQRYILALLAPPVPEGKPSVSANKIIVEGRPFLYNFDFLKFRGRAEENIRLSIPFACQGVCWKFKFAGDIRVWVNGHPLLCTATDEEANAYTLVIPFEINIGDEVCVEVTDTQPRWFRWFRRNTAHVTLEGLETVA